MESTRLARATRSLAGNSHWSRAIVCGTHLSSGRAESDARVASGRARLARPACVRTNLRVGDGGPFWRSGVVTERRNAPASARSPQPAADLHALIVETAKNL